MISVQGAHKTDELWQVMFSIRICSTVMQSQVNISTLLIHMIPGMEDPNFYLVVQVKVVTLKPSK